MKTLNPALSITTLMLCFLITSTIHAQFDFLPRSSQAATLTQRVGITDISIQYSRPGINGREVWGSLVPYGMTALGGPAPESPWRAGANENTVFTTTHDISIEGKALPAGTYGLHMIIEKDGKATVIFSKNYWSWGSYAYDPAEDALRVDVSTKEIPFTEQLTYTFDHVEANGVVAALNWEKKQVPFKIQVDVPNTVLTEIRRQLQTLPGYNRLSWEQAAGYALNNGGNLEEALAWINTAIEGQFFSEKNFDNLNIKSQILQKQGKTAEATAVMNEALQLGTPLQLHGYGRQLIAQNKKQEALDVFKLNAKLHKGEWPVDYGLARGYSAVGDYKTALKHLKIAESKAPDERNKTAIASNIKALEQGKDIN